MKKLAMRCAVLAVLGAAMVVCSTSSMTAANAEDITIKVVMKKVNKDGLCKALGTGLAAKEPKWDELATKSKELLPLAKAMPNNKPPKGDEESWKKFATAYAKAAEDLDKAVADKDAKAALAAQKVIAACGPCHMAHRPK
jgi:hypothetical protein